MRPRGLRVPWRRATATYWFAPRQPTRAAELANALAIEEDAGLVSLNPPPPVPAKGPIRDADGGESEDG